MSYNWLVSFFHNDGNSFGVASMSTDTDTPKIDMESLNILEEKVVSTSEFSNIVFINIIPLPVIHPGNNDQKTE